MKPLFLSKSRYTEYAICPKKFWLQCHKKELAVIDAVTMAVFEKGHEVGEKAKELFPGIIDVTTKKACGTLNYDEMCKKTLDLISKGCQAIAEAAFKHNIASTDDKGNTIQNTIYCAVDILVKVGDGVFDIFEVKSSTDVEEIYLHDIAFQRHVINSIDGLKVRDCYIVHINTDYVRKGDIDVNELFISKNVTALLEDYSCHILENIENAIKLHAQKSEPQLCLSRNCIEPYKCQFYDYCTKHLPKQSVFNVYNWKTKAFEHYGNGIVSFKDIQNSQIKLSDVQRWQINSQSNIDKKGIRSFLGKLKFPLYFLDFETWGMTTAIPLYDGQKPYRQIPFQYSIHILQNENDDTMTHKEFLADENKDEWRTLAMRLIQDIPDDGGSIMIYNKSFEPARIKEMAKAFSDLEEPLMKLTKRMEDMYYDVFKKGYLYTPEMGGSFSIKSVFPALSNDPELDYTKLKEVQNGNDATRAFLELKTFTNKKKRDYLREQLMAYCKLDTKAMGVLYRELRKKAL